MKVNFSAVPNENYNQARSSRLTAGSVDLVVAFPRELPSYVPAANEGDDARLADSGGFLDLTGQPFLKAFNQTVLDGTKYKGKNYTVPTGLSYYTGMFYNKKIFADNGINVPTTWQRADRRLRQAQGQEHRPRRHRRQGLRRRDHPRHRRRASTPTPRPRTTLAKGLYDGSVKLNDGKQLEVLQQACRPSTATPSPTSPA